MVRRGVVDRRTGDAERIDVAALPLLRGRRRSETAFPHLPVRLIERVHGVLFGRDDRQPADDDRGGVDRAVQLERPDALWCPARRRHRRRHARPAHRPVIGRPVGSASRRARRCGRRRGRHRPGAVAAGDAGPAPVHADSARITIAAAAGAVCRERISASVPSDRRATSLASQLTMARGTPWHAPDTPGGAGGPPYAAEGFRDRRRLQRRRCPLGRWGQAGTSRASPAACPGGGLRRWRTPGQSASGEPQGRAAAGASRRRRRRLPPIDLTATDQQSTRSPGGGPGRLPARS